MYIKNQEIVDIFIDALKKDGRIKICYKIQAGKGIQVQLYNGENFNIVTIKLGKNSYIIKR